MTHDLDVLIPTYNRAAALAVTLTTLAYQTYRGFKIIISDQSEDISVDEVQEIRAVMRFLELRGISVRVLRNLPRRGMAQQRQYLLEQATAPFVLYLDDDLLLEGEVFERLAAVLETQRCGFAGAAVVGLSFMNDVRPEEHVLEVWEGQVLPERVVPGDATWQRYVLHNAANLLHVQAALAIPPGRIVRYKVAWVGGCVLYDREKLLDCGGFSFWRDLPPSHCGEDVFAQLRTMEKYGGCGVLPSGVYHQELPTTVPDRTFNTPERLSAHHAEGRDSEWEAQR